MLVSQLNHRLIVPNLYSDLSPSCYTLFKVFFIPLYFLLHILPFIFFYLTMLMSFQSILFLFSLLLCVRLWMRTNLHLHLATLHVLLFILSKTSVLRIVSLCSGEVRQLKDGGTKWTNSSVAWILLFVAPENPPPFIEWSHCYIPFSLSNRRFSNLKRQSASAIRKTVFSHGFV